MKPPSWGLALIVIAFIAVRLWVGFRLRAPSPAERDGRSWFSTIPIWIRIFWMLLLAAVLIVLFWRPQARGNSTANVNTSPAPASVAPAQVPRTEPP